MVLCICAVGTAALASANLSLRLNDVSVSQVVKLSSVPMTIALEYFVYDQRFPSNILLSVTGVMFGLAVSIGQSLAAASMTVSGIVIGLACAAFGCMSNILNSRAQKSGIETKDFLSYVAPLQGLGLMGLSFVFEFLLADPSVDASTSPPWTVQLPTSALLLSSIVLAIIVNYSGMSVLKLTSALTFQVVSNVKLALFVIVDISLQEKPMDPRVILGFAITMLAATAHGYFSKLNAAKAAASTLPTVSK